MGTVAAQDTPTSIIILIGDGMGVGQVSAWTLSQDSSVFRRFPVSGFSLTQSANHFITESAAGATALFTGRRVPNGKVARDDSDLPLESVMQRARAGGKSVGVLATSEITHATPAAFLAHASSRKQQVEIAQEIVASGVELFIGGGRRRFLPKDKGGVREDGRDLLQELHDAGYFLALTPAALSQASLPLCGLLEMDALLAASQRTLPLAELVTRSVTLLDGDSDGFVLMVEGSQIDWACHDNNLPSMIAEMRDFDGAVSAALDYARNHSRTLVLVTADHETGGLTLEGTQVDGSDMKASWATKEHTASMVPVFAVGPGAHRFGGIHRNDEIGRILLELVSR